MSVSSGRLVLVVGQSGAGKDSLLRYAQTFFADHKRFVFPKRMITRQADVTAEDHESLDDVAFEALHQRGAFALTWEAHGLKYGVSNEIKTYLQYNRIVVVNASRAILAEAARKFSEMAVVEITASADTLAARIAARGRESMDEALRRSQRVVPPFPAELTVKTIHNEGTLDEAGRVFCAFLKELLDPAFT